tara:strand:- start:109 stop:1074 length:966 start_codon:yes stop_codon:yes gene_type:complete
MNIKFSTNGISDLQALLAFCLVSTLLLFFLPESTLRSFLVFLHLSIVLGYAIFSSIFPGNKIVGESDFASTFRGPEKSKLSFFDRLVPSFLISVATTSFVILFFEILSFSPGISLELLISIISTFFASVALIRRSNLEIQDRFNFEIDFQTPSPRELDRSNQIIAVCLLVASAFTASFVFEVKTTPMEPESYTELYFLDESNSFQSYPISSPLGQQNRISIGVSNQEGTPRTYELQLTHSFFGFDESSNRTSIGDPIFKENIVTSSLQDNFTLDHSSSRNFDYEFELFEEGLWGLEVELYTIEPIMEDSPYRRIFLWIEVS